MPSYSAVISRLLSRSSVSSNSPVVLLQQFAAFGHKSYHGSSCSETQQAGSFLPPAPPFSSMCGPFCVDRSHFRHRTHNIIHHDAFPDGPFRTQLFTKASQLFNCYFDPRFSKFQGACMRGTTSSQDATRAVFRAEKPTMVFGPLSCEVNTESNPLSITARSDERIQEREMLSPLACFHETEEVCRGLKGIEKVGVVQPGLPSIRTEDEIEETCLEQGASRIVSATNAEEEKLLAGRDSRKIRSSGATFSRVRTRSERKRKGTAFVRNIQNELPDLLAVPGIGPRNLEKLVAKGIGKVAELKQLYRDKFINDEGQQMVEFLQSSVGIVHKNHAESITSYVKNCVEEEQKEQPLAAKESCNVQNKKVTICVEGNISVGKTTFLRRVASEIIELRDLVEIVPEPVDQWKDVGPEHFNLLDAFYNEPERYAYTFQNYVFATRLMKEQETSKGIKPLRLMERSIFSDRLVFVRAVHEAKWMSELELRIYESWFDPFISALPGLVPDGFIYLRASPDTCLQRLHLRNRPEERSVTLEYLRGLHEKHEQCFFPSERAGGIYSVNPIPSHSHRLPPSPRIRDRIFYLEGDHLHSSIRKVPALILDCEASIDFNRDFEARAEYAQHVAEFYEYIRSNKDLEMYKTASSGIVNPFLLPYSGGLIRPDGCPLLHGNLLDGLRIGHRP